VVVGAAVVFAPVVFETVVPSSVVPYNNNSDSIINILNIIDIII
jgi:hypothetical protein